MLADANGAFGKLLFSMATVMFFETLPEELAFRGYIHRNLNTRLSRWLAGIVVVALFVLLPVVPGTIARQLPGMEVTIGGSTHLTAEYRVTMTVFGSFVQYSRFLRRAIEP